MDFYARQEAARRTTRWLLVAFLISVALVVAAVDAVVAFAMNAADPHASPTHAVVGSSISFFSCCFGRGGLGIPQGLVQGPGRDASLQGEIRL